MIKSDGNSVEFHELQIGGSIITDKQWYNLELFFDMDKLDLEFMENKVAVIENLVWDEN